MKILINGKEVLPGGKTKATKEHQDMTAEQLKALKEKANK